MGIPARTDQLRRTPGRKEGRPVVSIVLATHNRCEVVRQTIAQLHRSKLARQEYEIIAVDNASTDGTPRAIAPMVDQLVARPQNRGSCAKAYGVARARGRLIVFLDDDSCPRPDSLTRMIARFDADSRLGAAGFTVHLPGGGREGGALPGVFVGCGVGLRADALRAAGGLDPSFFMQAEEYDVCFRLAVAGWKVEVFDDLHVDHRKSATSRRPARTTYFDIRNNLRVLARYAPANHYAPMRQDCIERYAWLAAAEGHDESFRRGLRAGTYWAWIERLTFRPRRLTDDLFERFYRWREIERRMGEQAQRGVRRVVFADLGKNIYGYRQAARRCGITVEAIADDRLAAPGRTYRGVPVLPFQEALARDVDAVIVSNSSPIFAAATASRAHRRTTAPVFNWSRCGKSFRHSAHRPA